MGPKFTRSNIGNDAWVNSIFATNYNLSTRVLSYCQNFFRREFCHWVFYPAIGFPVLYCILHVFTSGTPFEIFNAIVISCAVFMATVNRARHRTSESRQYKPMNSMTRSYIFFREADMKIPIPRSPRRNNCASKWFMTTSVMPNNSVFAPNSPSARCGIVAFKP